MSEQWGRWFADAPQVEDSAEQVTEEPGVVEEEPVAVAEAVDDGFAEPTDDVPTDDVPTDKGVLVAEAFDDDESDAVAEPEPAAGSTDSDTDDESEDDSDPAVSSVYALRQRLSELEELPIEEHPARYEQLHSELTAALGQIDGGA